MLPILPLLKNWGSKLPYRKKKTGTKRVQKSRYNSSTGTQENYFVEVDVFSDVWEPDSSSYSGTDSPTSYGSDPGSYGGYSE